MLLFIAVEISPVLIKLMSGKGPYDNELKIAEHHFFAREVEEVARTNAQTKERVSTIPQHERTFVDEQLNAALKRT
jgi:hypothetical protein